MDLKQQQPQLLKVFNQILSQNRMSHAYLFSGEFGSFEMALYLAKSRFCLQLEDRLPCLKCRSCQRIDALEFSDVKIIEPVGQVIKTETVREMMKDFSKSGFEGNSQVFIIKESEKLHTNAVNSLLKYIEEPQTDAYIILLTADSQQLLPTIRSRTQIFHFPKNREFLYEMALSQDLLISQANLLADLAHTPDELAVLIAQKKTFDILEGCQRFKTRFLQQDKLLYLEVSRLAQLVQDRKEQELCFSMLVLLFSKELTHERTLKGLSVLHQARMMWLSNVSFQNSMEYLSLSV